MTRTRSWGDLAAIAWRRAAPARSFAAFASAFARNSASRRAASAWARARS
eukprot:CAMPEP_0206059362 /NCGR_PEP_ID=MMETSP1466-20131121/48800_1 /ASSEMBLY_ACC=CAM_ASM_001126 /TAXON_ID=44452 /ORGANISM="Pavlova gyrans, Strain CCMP608" /LENGTH=49 /DNA_ID= /DNA_START= /DNA_END= /DNA_ORIENTATION=